MYNKNLYFKILFNFQGSNFGRGSGGGGNFNNSRRTGHCVHMRGLPFRATELDIADFFRPLNPVNIRIIMDNSDRPSGEADVEFANHEDAVRAMSKDKSNMQHRYIELFLNSTPAGNMGGPMGNNGPMGSGSNFGPGGSNFGGSGFGGGYGGGGGGGGGGRMGGGRLDNYDDMPSRGGVGSRLGGFDNFNGGGFRGGPSNQMSGNNYNSFC